MTLNKYIQGEKIRIKGTVRDPTNSDALTDPATATITIVDSAGTKKQDGTAMTISGGSSGEVYYDYTIPSDGELGEWKYEVTVGANTSIEKDRFTVLEAI